MIMLVGIDYTQDGSPVASEILAYNFTEKELNKAISVMSCEHDDVYELEINQNEQVFIDTITKGKKVTK